MAVNNQTVAADLYQMHLAAERQYIQARAEYDVDLRYLTRHLHLTYDQQRLARDLVFGICKPIVHSRSRYLRLEGAPEFTGQQAFTKTFASQVWEPNDMRTKLPAATKSMCVDGDAYLLIDPFTTPDQPVKIGRQGALNTRGFYSPADPDTLDRIVWLWDDPSLGLRRVNVVDGEAVYRWAADGSKSINEPGAWFPWTGLDSSTASVIPHRLGQVPGVHLKTSMEHHYGHPLHGPAYADQHAVIRNWLALTVMMDLGMDEMIVLLESRQNAEQALLDANESDDEEDFEELRTRRGQWTKVVADQLAKIGGTDPTGGIAMIKQSMIHAAMATETPYWYMDDLQGFPPAAAQLREKRKLTTESILELQTITDQATKKLWRMAGTLLGHAEIEEIDQSWRVASGLDPVETTAVSGQMLAQGFPWDYVLTQNYGVPRSLVEQWKADMEAQGVTTPDHLGNQLQAQKDAATALAAQQAAAEAAPKTPAAGDAAQAADKSRSHGGTGLRPAA